MRPVPGYSNYLATERGTIINRTSGREFLGSWSGNAIITSIRRDDGKIVTHAVGHLVCLAFYGEPPDGHECCHKNDSHINNRPENLYWGTKSQNTADRARNGKQSKPLAKVTPDQVREIRRHRESGLNCKQIADMYSLGHSTISAIVNRYNWKDVV